MKEFETGAVRDTGGKGRCDLLPMCALIRVSKHMEDALTHYPERNWENGLPMHTMIDSALRHLMKYVDGWTDEDHLCAAATNLLMAMWTEEKRPDMQDIPSRSESKKMVELGKILASGMKRGLEGSSRTAPKGSQVVCGSYNHGRCLATKEMDVCGCGGDPTKCDFYPNNGGR